MMFEDFFNSETKARVVKFFIHNPNKFYEISEIVKRLALPSGVVKTQLRVLREEGFLKSRSTRSFSISYRFPYLSELKALVLKFPPVSDEFMLRSAKRMKGLKMLLIGGSLVRAEKGRVEVMIIGNNIRARTAETFVRQLEAKAAQELRYVLLTAEDFVYRKKMFDRFVLDVLEFPHRIVLNKLK